MALDPNHVNQMFNGAGIYQPYTELIQQVVNLNVPDLSEVKNVLEPVLRENFHEVNVSVVLCPDLRESPFHLAAPGLSGFPVIMEVGGPEFLWDYPTSEVNTSWKLPDLINQFCLGPSSFVTGASHGRSHGTFNYEVATNFTYSCRHGVTNKSYFSFVNKNGRCESKLVTNPNRVICNLYGNFFISNGNPGNVLKVYAKGRQTDMNFPTVIQSALQRKYEQNEFIGLGGTFIVKNGVVENILRRSNFQSNALFDWMFVYDFTPLVALGTILSREKYTADYRDLFGQNAEPNRLESNITTDHFHTFACNGVGVGGHFINDSTPDDIEYEGYFNLATQFIRVRPPQRIYRMPY